MIKHIVLASQVRRVGGGGVLALHLIDLLRSKGIEITLLSNGNGDNVAIDYIKSIGVKIVPWPARDWSRYNNEVVLSVGNPQFLMALQDIKATSNARTILISNMWQISNVEQHALLKGYVDDLVHVSCAQREEHQKFYKEWNINPPERYGYKPYFNLENPVQNLSFNYKEPVDYFTIGRISRPDEGKFPKDTWETYRKIRTPLPKKILINSFDGNVEKKIGPVPTDMDVKTFYPYEVNIKYFLDQTNLIFQQTDTAGESLGYYILEAMACGVPLVLQKGYALNEIGETGVHYLAGNTTEDMIGLASNLSQDRYRMKEMAFEAHLQLLRTYANEDYCYEFWQNLLA